MNTLLAKLFTTKEISHPCHQHVNPLLYKYQWTLFCMNLKLCVFPPQPTISWDELAPAPMTSPIAPSAPRPALPWDAKLPCPRCNTEQELHQQPDHLLARKSPRPLFADDELGPTCPGLAHAHHPAPWVEEEIPTIWSAGAA